MAAFAIYVLDTFDNDFVTITWYKIAKRNLSEDKIHSTYLPWK